MVAGMTWITMILDGRSWQPTEAHLEHLPDVGDQSPGVVLGHWVEVSAGGLTQPHHGPLHGSGQLEEGGPQLRHSPGLLLHLLLHQSCKDDIKESF